MSDSFSPLDCQFSRVWAALTLLLIAVTYPLWWSPFSVYPAIPLFHTLGSPAQTLLPVTSAVLVAALSMLVLWPKRTRLCWAVVGASLIVGFLLDQHRLQPWAYQTAIYAILFAVVDRSTAVRFCIPVAASIYFYSALGKFDYQFTHTVGQRFLETITGGQSGFLSGWSITDRAKLALVFPVIELTSGIGLLFQRTRRLAGIVLMSMHAGLIVVLGPWGLDHSGGVLAWNVALMIQNLWLMVWPQDNSHLGNDETSNRPSMIAAPVVYVLALFVLVAPIFERYGYWDHWLSWSLYSPHTSRVELQVHQTAVDRLPTPIQMNVDSEDSSDGWCEVILDRWSLQSRWVPIYPQARYQLNLVQSISDQYSLDNQVRVIIQSVADRFDGSRSETRLIGSGEIETYLSREYFFR